jgi:hypothetical protein
MQHGQFELAVAIHRDGRSPRIREYGHNGITYVEGRKGQPFSVVFKNNSPARVLAIVSIDGLSVIEGEPATGESRGYVVNGYSSVEIRGWRTSLDQTQQFVFENKTGSYTASTPSGTANCGVIACKVLAERPRPVQIRPQALMPEKVYVPVPYPVYPGPVPMWCYEPTTSTSGVVPHGTPAMVNCCAPATDYSASLCVNDTPDFTLGTGWGSTQEDRCNETTFERGLELATFSLYYTDAESLKRIGVNLGKDLAVNALPQGFGNFCKPPGVAR